MKKNFTFIDLVFISMQAVNLFIMLQGHMNKDTGYIVIFMILIGYFIVDKLDKISKR